MRVTVDNLAQRRRAFLEQVANLPATLRALPDDQARESLWRGLKFEEAQITFLERLAEDEPIPVNDGARR